jgi:thiol:disulfide interchange protein
MKFLYAAALSLAVGWSPLFAQADEPADATSTGIAASSSYVPVHKFDSKRDAAADIRAAIVEAQRTGKRIILDVGGDWCTWCHVLDKFFEQHSEIAELRDKNFITVNIYYGHEEKNEKALSRFPKVEGIPHFFVLEKDGSFLFSQAMLKLETGGEPSVLKMKDFLMKWAPGTTGNAEKKH